MVFPLMFVMSICSVTLRVAVAVGLHIWLCLGSTIVYLCLCSDASCDLLISNLYTIFLYMIYIAISLLFIDKMICETYSRSVVILGIGFCDHLYSYDVNWCWCME